jgi:hypothetical protein
MCMPNELLKFKSAPELHKHIVSDKCLGLICIQFLLKKIFMYMNTILRSIKISFHKVSTYWLIKETKGY